MGDYIVLDRHRYLEFRSEQDDLLRAAAAHVSFGNRHLKLYAIYPRASGRKLGTGRACRVQVFKCEDFIDVESYADLFWSDNPDGEVRLEIYVV